MKKHFRCIIDICDNNMQYPKLHKKHNNVDGDIIMHNLPKDGVVKAAWINTLKRYKKLKTDLILLQQHPCLVDDLFQAQYLIKSIQVQWSSSSGECFSSPTPIYHKHIKSIQIH